MNFSSAGLAIGVVVGIIIVYFIMRIVNKDNRFRTEYDEMQKIIRGDAYRVAFYTVLIFEALMCFLSTMTELPMEPFVVHFLAILIGVLTQAGYCIWKGAYVGLNTRMNRFVVMAVVVSAINLLVAFMAWRNGSLFEGGKLQAPFVNLLCGIMFAILGVVGLIRWMTGSRTEEE